MLVLLHCGRGCRAVAGAGAGVPVNRAEDTISAVTEVRNARSRQESPQKLMDFVASGVLGRR
jgi:hypothetical protein